MFCRISLDVIQPAKNSHQIVSFISANKFAEKNRMQNQSPLQKSFHRRVNPLKGEILHRSDIRLPQVQIPSYSISCIPRKTIILLFVWAWCEKSVIVVRMLWENRSFKLTFNCWVGCSGREKDGVTFPITPSLRNYELSASQTHLISRQPGCSLCR